MTIKKLLLAFLAMVILGMTFGESNFTNSTTVSFTIILMYAFLYYTIKYLKNKYPNGEMKDAACIYLCLVIGPIGWIYLIAREDIKKTLQNKSQGI
jgi:hypothetical protein